MDNSENDKNDKSPLLKPKKPRPPPSEKQMENFKKMAEKRAENIAKKKEDKILQAKRELLEKEGYVKKDITKETQEKESVQFKISDDETDKVEPIPQPNKVKKVLKARTIDPLPLDKTENKKQPVKEKKIKQKVIEPESSSSEDEHDDDSTSSEEIVIIKRSKKPKTVKAAKPVKQPKQRQVIQQEEEDEEEEYVAKQTYQPNYINYFL